jgi:hypothetical protein
MRMQEIERFVSKKNKKKIVKSVNVLGKSGNEEFLFCVVIWAWASSGAVKMRHGDEK